MTDRHTALRRLTDNEKECLRRRLRHQTAKEMALDLGISPHAVEKRLKMARLKLGVGSSLAAARLLAVAEAGATVPPTPDLPHATSIGQGGDAAPLASPRRRWPPGVPFAGVTLMILAALLALSFQAPPPPASPLIPDGSEAIVVLPQDAAGPHTAAEPATERVEDVSMRPAGPAEVAAFALSSFGTMDKNGSGFVEQTEAPAAGVGIPTPGDDTKVQWFTGPRGQAMWVANMDIDRDGRASKAEYVAWDAKVWRDHVPANWAWQH